MPTAGQIRGESPSSTTAYDARNKGTHTQTGKDSNVDDGTRSLKYVPHCSSTTLAFRLEVLTRGSCGSKGKGYRLQNKVEM